VVRIVAIASFLLFASRAGQLIAQPPLHPPQPLGGRRYPEPPRGQTGLYEQWYSVTASDTVFVFVHGILSNNRDAWWFHDQRSASDSSHDAYWPELVAQDARFNSPSIYLAGYYTAPRSGGYDIAQAARAMANALAVADVNGTRVLSKRNIVFVGHSTGGLVVRYLLYHYQYLFRGKNVGLVLMASPAQGSQWADRFSLLINLAGNEMASELRPENPFIQALFTDFQDLVDNKFMREFSLTGASACENHFVLARRFLPDLDVVVDPQSCGAFFSAPVLIRDSDHFSVVKPSGVNSQSHTFLLGFYQQRFGPLVKEGTAVADTIRVTVRPQPQVWVQTDSAWTFSNTLPQSVCSSDGEFSSRVVPPSGWKLPAITRVAGGFSDSSAVRLIRIVSDGDSAIVAVVGRRQGAGTSTGSCTGPLTLTIRTPLSTSRRSPTPAIDSTIVTLTRNSPQVVLDAPVVKLSPREFVRWDYDMHVKGIVDGTPFEGPMQETVRIGSWTIGGYRLVDGRILLIATSIH
jgi:pimeloyl-ACP methyl ester carboxylesterase